MRKSVSKSCDIKQQAGNASSGQGGKLIRKGDRRLKIQYIDDPTNPNYDEISVMVATEGAADRYRIVRLNRVIDLIDRPVVRIRHVKKMK